MTPHIHKGVTNTYKLNFCMVNFCLRFHYACADGCLDGVVEKIKEICSDDVCFQCPVRTPVEPIVYCRA